MAAQWARGIFDCKAHLFKSSDSDSKESGIDNDSNMAYSITVYMTIDNIEAPYSS